MELPTAASDRRLDIVINIQMEYSVSEAMGEVPSKHSLIFLLPV